MGADRQPLHQRIRYGGGRKRCTIRRKLLDQLLPYSPVFFIVGLDLRECFQAGIL